ncbi:thioredoxin family protein [Comamonas aquatica]|nr:thioredoxin family protein [Comamonas aquatica]
MRAASAPSWQPVADEAALQQVLQQPLALVLWGGAHCGVCQAIKPRLAQQVAAHFPQLPLYSVDCAQAPAACAQHGVFSLPVLRLMVDGRVALDYARVFGLQQVLSDTQRVLQQWADAQPR